MIQEKEYEARRLKLSKKLDANSLTILFSAEYQTRSNDTEYPFRQNSNFYYLTGFKEDKSVLLIVKKAKKSKFILFVEKKDKTKELWNGKRLGAKLAKDKFLVDEVYEIQDLITQVKALATKSKKIYHDLNDKRVENLKKELPNITSFQSVISFIEEQRLIKSSQEIKLIKKAIQITKDAHHYAMTHAKALSYEFELQAGIEYVFKKNGAYSDAYTSIVACGNAANTLHYIANNQALIPKKLILIDAGCEYDYYASDITRTIPVDGKFTKPQQEVYDMVLAVQLKILAMIKPGIKRTALQKKAIKLLTQGMIDLKILTKSLKTCIKKELYKKYYPHGIGHWMGIDVHDECPYKNKNGKEIPLKKGMVLTIEPGIYLDTEDKKIPKKYRGIGIRIEDDILVTKDGSLNLSQDIAKTIQEIESF